jgi:type II pantothenate kinase
VSQIVGIDIGGSTTKIVGFYNETILSPLLVKADDPVASLYGAFGKFLNINGLKLGDVKKVMVTGAGSSFITDRLYGIPTGKVNEFQAIGMGGLFLSRLPRAIIVSMGTGTALVIADKNGTSHIGGTGVGGGTLLGLSNRMLNVRNFQDIVDMAQGGNLANVDLTIGDITCDMLDGLPNETTASNFGKISDLAANADIALGIINLVFQTIGMVSVFASRIHDTADIVLTGNLTNVPQLHDIFGGLANLFGVSFHTPENAEYATAVGAAINFARGRPFTEIGV